jgi:hypothetical protein
MNFILLQITKSIESIVMFLENYVPRLSQVLQDSGTKKPPELSTKYITKGSRTRSGPPGYNNL